ncbi:MAG TPA: pantoate--beta-alanine ligase [Solirubrobacterales bacterium]|nr:pantoate--beta-alanine ligase [Solirubrobacterales bacterium]
MRIARTRDELRDALAPARREGRTIGLVPTMGSLHDGHRSLLEAAAAGSDFVVMSLFVNPAQFGPGEDLERYPRDLDRDADLAAAAGADLIYAPTVEDVYPSGFATAVEVGGLTDVLCGDPARRGRAHFRGVTTIVAKLLNAIRPGVAYFGQKDAQQAVVVRRMVADLDYDVRIEVLPTVREPDGLAMSSRNARLTAADRERAPALYRALRAAAGAARPGIAVDDALAPARAELAAAGVEAEYLEARDATDLSTLQSFNGRPTLIAVAAQLGEARLIDNVVVATAATEPGRQDDR